VQKPKVHYRVKKKPAIAWQQALLHSNNAPNYLLQLTSSTLFSNICCHISERFVTNIYLMVLPCNQVCHNNSLTSIYKHQFLLATSKAMKIQIKLATTCNKNGQQQDKVQPTTGHEGPELE
jgi:hypothetical protein